jgi:hypothetical protein
VIVKSPGTRNAPVELNCVNFPEASGKVKVPSGPVSAKLEPASSGPPPVMGLPRLALKLLKTRQVPSGCSSSQETKKGWDPGRYLVNLMNWNFA